MSVDNMLLPPTSCMSCLQKVEFDVCPEAEHTNDPTTNTETNTRNTKSLNQDIIDTHGNLGDWRALKC